VWLYVSTHTHRRYAWTAITLPWSMFSAIQNNTYNLNDLVYLSIAIVFINLTVYLTLGIIKDLFVVIPFRHSSYLGIVNIVY